MAELTPDARKAWQPATQDHGHDAVGIAIRQACFAERDEARLRGTSARAEQLGMLTPEARAQLSRLILEPSFAARVHGVA